jgi:hypothetical protein
MTVRAGSGRDAGIAGRERRYREKYGLTYFGVLETSMSDLAKVIECLRSA